MKKCIVGNRTLVVFSPFEYQPCRHLWGDEAPARCVQKESRMSTTYISLKLNNSIDFRKQEPVSKF